MPTQDQNNRELLLKAVRLSQIAVITAAAALLVALVGNGVTLHVSNNQSRAGREAHAAGCAQRDSLAEQVRKSNALLASHPKAALIDVDDGPNILFLSRSVIVSQRNTQQARLTAIDQSGLDCK